MNNSKGMSLAGVLTATAIMTILMVGFLTFFTDLLKGQKHLEQKFGSVYLHNEIYQTLSNEPSCSMTFANKEFTYNATQSASVYTDVVQIKSGNNQVLYSTINDTTNPNKFYDGNNLKIKEIKFHKYTPKETPADANDIKYYSGYAFVQIEYEKNQKNIGNQTFVKEVKLDVTLKKQGAPIDPANPAVTYTAADDKKLKSCYALGGQGGDSYWQPTLAADGIFYSGGKVGVGTAAPDTDFQVTRSGASPRLAIRNPEELPVFFELAGTAGVNGNEGFEIEYTNGGDTYLRNRYYSAGAGPVGTGSLLFQTNTSTFAGGVVNNNLTLHGNGNVGIGITNPVSRPGVITPTKFGNQFNADLVVDIQKPGLAANRDIQVNVGDLILNSRRGGGTSVEAKAGPGGSNGNIVITAENLIAFQTADDATNATYKMWINKIGNVGIGTTNPTTNLQVDGGTSRSAIVYLNGIRDGNHSAQLRLNDNNTGKGWLLVNGKMGAANNHFQIVQANTLTGPYSYPFTILESGNLGLGTTNPAYQLQLSTDSAAKPGSAAWTVASDIRLKNITGEFTKGLNEILAIDPIYFKYKKVENYKLPTDQKFVGVVAQEIEKVIPEAISKDQNGYLQVTNDAVIWSMVNAIKELYKKVLATFDRISIMENKINQLQLQNEELKKYICKKDPEFNGCVTTQD